MKLALYGAAGMVGSRIAKEALDRGHSVTALVRHAGKLALKHPQLKEVQADAAEAVDVAAKVAGHDAVIVSISPRGDGGVERFMQAAHSVMQGCKQAGVRRLLWIGGAGSLEVGPGQLLLDQPYFPAEYLGEAKAAYEVLKLFRAETQLEWTFFSPAALLAPGERRGKFKLGGDQLVTDAKGESRLSMEDLAYACVYQLEKGGKIRQRFTAAYVD